MNRTKYTPNEIVDKLDGTAYICLYDSKNKEIGRAIVDSEDIEILRKFKWCKDKNGYVKNSKQQYLHKVVLKNFTDFIDHINGNTLDNRKSNLRKCSNSDNLKNRVRLPSNNTSGIIGVRFRSDRQKWYAEIKANGVVHRLGSFLHKEDAINARKNAEIKYFGEYKSKILNYEVN